VQPVIDPHAKVNERIRGKRRAQGRRDDEYDALIRAASHELGATAEAALGVFLDVAERVGLRYLEEAARTGATRNFRWTPDAVRAARFATSRLPGASGRVVSQSSEWAVRTGFSVLRELRRRLEDTRRGMGPSGDRPRRPPPTPPPPRTPPGKRPTPSRAQEKPRARPADPRRAPTPRRERGEDRAE
jgi:hypothetical protein